MQLRYGYALSPQVELFGAVNYGKGKLKYQSSFSFNTEHNNNEGRTTGYGANVGMAWRYPITANLSWQNMVDLAYGYKELSHLTTSNDVQISKLKTQFSSLGAVSQLNYQFGNINLFAHTRVQKTLSSKTKGEVNYVGVQAKVDQSNKIYPKTQVQFGAGSSYQYKNWKISISVNVGNYHQKGTDINLSHSF
ncbi:autotransporter domain-containing protein [Avibacterium avium]|uniref:autotransporter domain-containing protein n=1 Tax=Avibacterium avium TaxID=751 RepID=UPI003BF7D491